MLAGMAWMKLSGLPGCTAVFAGSSTFPWPLHRKAASTAAMTSAIETPTFTTSERLRYLIVAALPSPARGVCVLPSSVMASFATGTQVRPRDADRVPPVPDDPRHHER